MDKITELREKYKKETGIEFNRNIFEYSDWLEDQVVKLFAIPAVSNRREQLIAFMVWENRTHNIPRHIIERAVDKYLKSN